MGEALYTIDLDMSLQNTKRAFMINNWHSIVWLWKSYFIYKEIEWAERNPRNFEMGTEGFSSTFSLTTTTTFKSTWKYLIKTKEIKVRIDWKVSSD